MVQRVSTVAFEGIEARAVDVQVQVAPGLPAFAIVGLPDKAVSEARERVRSAAAGRRRHAGGMMGRAERPSRGQRAAFDLAGGMRAKPGEISLAHQGVLFLDELPEFDPRVLDSLRQPLENGEVAVSRANHRVTYPARFMLVAAMNPCRCGQAYEPGFSCKRGRIDRCTSDYQTRISGPLMDRIDLRIEVPAVTATDLILPPPAEGSAEVAAAREVQMARYAAAGLPHIRTNAEAPASVLEVIATRRGKNCCATPRRPCGCRRGAITAYCALPERSPTSIAPKRSAGCIWRRPCPTARSPKTSGAPPELIDGPASCLAPGLPS
jgi:Magnesium chelatase, subunit ChlI/Subunit ChlI of Mg-chelatase